MPIAGHVLPARYSSSYFFPSAHKIVAEQRQVDLL